MFYFVKKRPRWREPQPHHMIKQINNVRIERVKSLELKLKAFFVNDLASAHETNCSPYVTMGEHVTRRGRRSNVD